MTTSFPFIYRNTDVQSQDPDQEESWLRRFGDKAWRDAASFIYEMPYTIVALTAAGIAAAILFPVLAPPCFGLVAGVVISRLVVKVVDNYNPLYLLDVKREALKINEKYSNVLLICFVFATFLAIASPLLGTLATLGLGLYQGIIIQVEIYDYKRQLRVNELKQN